MSVDKATVAKIASLARISMDDAALEQMVPELNGILQWVEQLGEVDVTGIEPMAAVIPNTLRLRADVVDADPLTGGGGNPQQDVHFDGWTLSHLKRELTTPQQLLVPLSNAEYRLLCTFLERPQRILSREIVRTLGGEITATIDNDTVAFGVGLADRI